MAVKLTEVITKEVIKTMVKMVKTNRNLKKVKKIWKEKKRSQSLMKNNCSKRVKLSLKRRSSFIIINW